MTQSVILPCNPFTVRSVAKSKELILLHKVCGWRKSVIFLAAKFQTLFEFPAGFFAGYMLLSLHEASGFC